MFMVRTTDDIGSRIRIARERKGLSQATLADLVGVRGPTVWRYEQGDIKPGVDVIIKLANALGVALEWLHTGTSPEVQNRGEQSPEAREAVEAFLQTPLGQSVSEEDKKFLYSLDFQRTGVTNSAALVQAVYLDRLNAPGERLNRPLSPGKRMLKRGEK